MNMKSFAIVAVSGLLAASLAYVAPAMADDMSNNGTTMQAPADNSNPGGAGASQGGDNNMGNNGGTGGSSDQGATGSSGNNNSDQGSPDTATGDDDY